MMWGRKLDKVLVK